LHLEFEDLQSYCNQLQNENKELHDGIIARKKKSGWFSSDQTRRLNQPRRRIDYKNNDVDASQDPPNSWRDETSLARGREEDDWDAEHIDYQSLAGQVDMARNQRTNKARDH
jgi:hypothetical protein